MRPAFRLALLLGWLLLALPVRAQDVRPLDLARQSYLRSDQLGITFVAFTDNIGRDATTRYQRALELGAGWTRYPIYWNEVERSKGSYSWGAYDALVDADRAAGLRTNAILMGTPGFYGGGGSITGLTEPVFADGTDTPAPGKQINPANPWAAFVYAAVQRYRPGGMLARQRGWSAASGITVWEAWNEPDFPWFWRATRADYARLLKVTYLAAKQADPGAQVMFGGLAYGNPDTNDWLRDVLRLYSQDPSAAANNGYMDIVGLHSYTDARRTGLVINRVKETLASFGLSKPIWLNEYGVAVWDDYPGPLWAADEPGSRRLRATQAEQAAYVVQSTAYAFAAGADKVFWHQLYDDCGNEAGNHAPESRGAGDAYGIFRNPAYASCFSQHPQPGTPRLSAEAYKVMARVFGRGAFANGRVLQRGDGSVFIQFERPASGERITVIWNENASEITTAWAATSPQAQVFSYTRPSYIMTPTDGSYRLTLPPARLNDDPQRPPGTNVLIGGAAFIVVEQTTAPPAVVAREPALPAPVTPRAPLPSAIGSVLGGGASPSTTMTLEQDLTPPLTGVEPLPEVSPETFTVRWNGADASGIEKYLVWVRVNDGEWQPWLETARTESAYVGAPGMSYAFAVWALDNAGNWSLNTDLQPQAQTRIE